jgi:hypothetical protein
MNPLESVLECYFDNTARELAKNEARRGMSLADTKKGADSWSQKGGAHEKGRR